MNSVELESEWFETPRPITLERLRAVMVFAALRGGDMLQFVSPKFRAWIDNTSSVREGGELLVTLDEDYLPTTDDVAFIDGDNLLYYRILMQNRFKNL